MSLLTPETGGKEKVRVNDVEVDEDKEIGEVPEKLQEEVSEEDQRKTHQKNFRKTYLRKSRKTYSERL